MSPNPHDTLFIHLYGIINGLYVAAFMYILLFGISYYLQNKQRHIGMTFLIAALGYGCVGLYNLFFQYTHLAVTTQIIPESVFQLAKYAAPLAMVVITYIFIRLTILKSYHAFRIIKRYKHLIRMLYLIDVLCFFVLFFVQDELFASFLIILLFIPHGIGACYYAYRTLDRGSLLLSLILLLGLIIMAWLAWLIYQDSLQIPAALFLTLHAIFAFLLLVFSFVTIRYGYDEAKRFFDIKQLDSKNLIGGIYKAIQDNEFYLVYQPKIDLITQKTCGLEALIRWEHPTLGNIPPTEFIPLAEQTNLIHHITQWTIDTAVKQARILMDQQIDAKISINFSVLDVTVDNVLYLTRAIEKYSVPTSKLMVEITESLFIDLTKEQTQALDMLYALDISLSLDDYGTGFSSLSHINKLSLSELKIDSSFIQDIDTNTDNRVIVDSTLQMSQGLKLQVVAEGVEDQHTATILQQLGCHMIQGYGISKPLKASQLRDWFISPRGIISS